MLFCGSREPALPVVSTQCDQKFTFFFKSQFASEALWIGEELYGACGQTDLLQVFVDDQHATLKKTEIDAFQHWQWIENLKKIVKLEPHTPLNIQTQTAQCCGIKLKAPKYNEKLLNLYEESYAHLQAADWNAALKTQGIDLPQTAELQLELLYAYPNGLYFNYELDQVYLFSQSKILLIFIRQNKRCQLQNTMHGFLVCKYKNKS